MLILIEELEERRHGNKMGLYECSVCHRKKKRVISAVNRKEVKDCACAKYVGSLKHKMRNTPEYNVWVGIKQRCYNKNNLGYSDYGGRGIKVCDRWLESFENFFEDMGLKPNPELQIERINNDGDYCPENCKWATRKEEANNKRDNVNIPYNGRTQTLTQWSEELVIPHYVLRNRICKYGWSVEKAFTTLAKKIKKRNIPWNGKIKSITQWAKEFNMNVSTLQSRLDVYKWSIEKALTTPVKKRKKKND